MEFVCYSNWADLPVNANTLFSKFERNSIFYSRIWFENLVANALKEEQSMLLACVKDRVVIRAILPLMQLPQSSLNALSNHYTTHYSLLMDENQPEKILNCLAGGLMGLDFQSLRLEPIDTSDQNLLALKNALEARGLISHEYFRFYNWIHRLNNQTFDAYMANRPSSLRNTIARKKRKLQRERDHAISLYTESDLEQALFDYQKVYQASWKTNEFFTRFKPTLVKKLSRLGWLRLGILYIQEQPVAAQIWFVAHGKASIFRLAYDENWQQYSPGSILTEYMMRYVIDKDKVLEIDFLTGNERYKQDWMTEGRERCGWHFIKAHKPEKLLSRINKLFKYQS